MKERENMRTYPAAWKRTLAAQVKSLKTLHCKHSPPATVTSIPFKSFFHTEQTNPPLQYHSWKLYIPQQGLPPTHSNLSILQIWHGMAQQTEAKPLTSHCIWYNTVLSRKHRVLLHVFVYDAMQASLCSWKSLLSKRKMVPHTEKF